MAFSLYPLDYNSAFTSKYISGSNVQQAGIYIIAHVCLLFPRRFPVAQVEFKLVHRPGALPKLLTIYNISEEKKWHLCFHSISTLISTYWLIFGN